MRILLRAAGSACRAHKTHCMQSTRVVRLGQQQCGCVAAAVGRYGAGHMSGDRAESSIATLGFHKLLDLVPADREHELLTRSQRDCGNALKASFLACRSQQRLVQPFARGSATAGPASCMCCRRRQAPMLVGCTQVIPKCLGARYGSQLLLASSCAPMRLPPCPAQVNCVKEKFAGCPALGTEKGDLAW